VAGSGRKTVLIKCLPLVFLNNNTKDMHRSDQIKTTGKSITEAEKVMIMIHGRGASADSILGLANYFNSKTTAYIAPQATGGSWYPYSFLAPMDQNEPGLSSALSVIHELVEKVKSDGFADSQIYFLGFSQGACLALEFAARNPGQYGGVFGLSGGLIGPPGTDRNYPGSLAGTPVFLGCSDIDSHIPKDRVLESGEVLENMRAAVTVKLYPNFGHSVNEDEINFINGILLD
jgi:phospholipase/carboxylesterase